MRCRHWGKPVFSEKNLNLGVESTAAVHKLISPESNLRYVRHAYAEGDLSIC